MLNGWCVRQSPPPAELPGALALQPSSMLFHIYGELSEKFLVSIENTVS